MNARRTAYFALAGIIALLCCAAHAQENWPQWRGPDQNSVSTSTGLPTTWSESEHVVWKTLLPSWGGGSPIIWGDRVFVTSPAAGAAAEAEAQGDGRSGTPSDAGGSELLLLCVSKPNGEILWQRVLDDGNRLWRKQNDASPSPVTDGRHVWAVAGTGAVNAFDMDGAPIWRKELQEEYGPFGLQFGYASSPVLYDGQLIFQVLHGYRTDDPSYIVALDALTGEERWRQERPTDAPGESPDAYTTPALLRHEGSVQIVISGGDYVTGHDPATGAEIWRAAGLNPNKSSVYRIVASPVVADGMIYAPSRKKPVLALRAGGTGDITESHLAWKWDAWGAPDVPTPACDGTYLYLVDDTGGISCVDAKTGEGLWGTERPTRGAVSASPLLGDGKLYVTNEDGVTTVVAAGPEFKVLATNTLPGGYTLSSMAVSNRQLFIRTAAYLYCIGE
ncbi:MAG: PQQ-binding-like beta-propeller repeat protein [Candidatus Hydrogenedentes bacterium]|nr:PQQ-binding-like beta-propeller repeat protein [Candidatus Hydrogenedentota bacterium]